jgi:hypothetical protein
MPLRFRASKNEINALSSSLVFPILRYRYLMGSVLCRQREGPWVYGVASPSTPPSKVPDNSVRLHQQGQDW